MQREACMELSDRMKILTTVIIMVIIIIIIIGWKALTGMKDSADIRKINLQKIRSLLWSGEWKTKQQLAAETGLSVATCNTLLNELSNTGEVLSEKTRIHEVGPGALRYRINEGFESILCIWFDRLGNEDVLTAKVLAVTGSILYQERYKKRVLTFREVQREMEKVFQKFPNISVVVVGTPSIAENGIIRHCDIPELENEPIVSELSRQFGVPVYLENDMHFKVFGYSKKHNADTDVVTLANFPVHILPGTATVHNGMVIKGHNQFAGMVGFLPYDLNREELLAALQPDACRHVVSKAVASLISILNPAVMILTGNLLDETCVQWIQEDCMQWIPESYMPKLIYQADTEGYYLEGMYQKALELKGAFR